MRSVVPILILTVASVALAAKRGVVASAETPRATDLLRAEEKAQEARDRLRLPAPPRRSGWRSGGTWDDERSAPPRPR